MVRATPLSNTSNISVIRNNDNLEEVGAVASYWDRFNLVFSVYGADPQEQELFPHPPDTTHDLEIVYNSVAKVVQLYVDTVLQATRTYDTAPTAKIRTGGLGCWAADPTRRLEG